MHVNIIWNQSWTVSQVIYFMYHMEYEEYKICTREKLSAALCWCVPKWVMQPTHY